MPHIYAKYKYGFKVTDWQHQSLCAKNHKRVELLHREQKDRGGCAQMMQFRVKDEFETWATFHFRFSCALKILLIKK